MRGAGFERQLQSRAAYETMLLAREATRARERREVPCAELRRLPAGLDEGGTVRHRRGRDGLPRKTPNGDARRDARFVAWGCGVDWLRCCAHPASQGHSKTRAPGWTWRTPLVWRHTISIGRLVAPACFHASLAAQQRMLP
eukprot:364602-Chlamydomonas_euryale.AAC.4